MVTMAVSLLLMRYQVGGFRIWVGLGFGWLQAELPQPTNLDELAELEAVAPAENHYDGALCLWNHCLKILLPQIWVDGSAGKGGGGQVRPCMLHAANPGYSQ